MGFGWLIGAAGETGLDGSGSDSGLLRRIGLLLGDSIGDSLGQSKCILSRLRRSFQSSNEVRDWCSDGGGLYTGRFPAALDVEASGGSSGFHGSKA